MYTKTIQTPKPRAGLKKSLTSYLLVCDIFLSVCMFVPYSFIWAYSFIRELRVTGQVLFFAIGTRKIAKAGWEHISCQYQSRNSSSFYNV